MTQHSDTPQPLDHSQLVMPRTRVQPETWRDFLPMPPEPETRQARGRPERPRRQAITKRRYDDRGRG